MGDSKINHKIPFIKTPFINKGIDFIDLPSIFQDIFVTSSSLPDYFQKTCQDYVKDIGSNIRLSADDTILYIIVTDPDTLINYFLQIKSKFMTGLTNG